jgi:hypothetical protein
MAHSQRFTAIKYNSSMNVIVGEDFLEHRIQTKDADKERHWPSIAILIVLCVVVGLAPLLYLLWWASPHRVEPLSVRIPLERGQFFSPRFTTDANDDYQIDIYFLPFDRPPLHLAWKIVDDHGKLLASGAYDEQQAGGNNAILGHYRGVSGVGQTILVTVHQDESLASGDQRLHIGLPERSLAAGYVFIVAVSWAVLVAIVCIVSLLILTFRRHSKRLLNETR